MFFEIIAVLALILLLFVIQGLRAINRNLAKWGTEHIKYMNHDLRRTS